VTTHVWTVTKAKARFSELIARARSDGPQAITRYGRTAVVVVSALEWERKTKRVGNLAEFFAAPPLEAEGLAKGRQKSGFPHSRGRQLS